MRRLFGGQVAAMVTSVGFLSAAVTLTSLLTINAAQAATFSIVGGHDAKLLANFDPAGWVNADNFNLGVGSTVTRFRHGNAAGGNGLFVSGPGLVDLKYTYEGTEASYKNLFEAAFTLSLPALFDNKTSTVGDNQTFTGLSSGLVPAFFESVTPGNKDAINGTSINKDLKIAFAVVNGGSTAYVFLEDIARKGDKDFDDMVIRIDAFDAHGSDPPVVTPLPAALPLFAGGLGVLGFFARRRRKRAALAAA